MDFSSTLISLNPKCHSHTLLTFCVRGSEESCRFSKKNIFSQLVGSAFTQMQQSREKNQYGHFYLPPSGLFDCSVTPKGSAVLRGRSRHPFISVSSFVYVSEVEGQRRKEQKRQEENLLMESSGKIREEVNSNESLGGTAGSLGWKKNTFNYGRRNEKHGQQQRGGEQEALPPSAYPPCLRPSGCRSNEPQVLDEF